MSKEKNNKTLIERFKLWLVNRLLRLVEKLLAKEISIEPNPPINPSIPLKQPTPEEIEEMKAILAKKLAPIIKELPNNSEILSREVDFNFEDDQSEVMNKFDLDVKDLMDKYLDGTSALVVAGPLMANGLRLYRTVLSQEDYDQILYHIYETRNQIKPVALPQGKNNNTVH